jgi:predicted DNA-binding protein (UPF0251 family)
MTRHRGREGKSLGPNLKDSVLAMEEEPRRGRPRIRRSIHTDGPVRCFSPQCQVQEPEDAVVLLPEELELLRLVDLQGLEQEEAAAALGVSRRTAWRDLHEARRKVADALIHGKNIEVTGCTLEPEGQCPKQDVTICPKEKGGVCPKRWRRGESSRQA